MSLELDNIRFSNASPRESDNAQFVGRIPKTCKSVDDLFDRLHSALHFPDYFGRNWNALFDLLCDLSWIKEYTVVVFHEGIPEIGAPDLHQYIDVLVSAVLDWSDDPTHKLVVVFPEKCRDLIGDIIAENERLREGDQE